MNILIDKIDRYIIIKEKEEEISLSMKKNISLDEAIRILKKSHNKNKTISMFSDDIKEKLKELIEGGII